MTSQNWNRPKSTHTPELDNYRKHKRYRHRKANNIPAYMPADIVRNHIKTLLGDGLSTATISRASGVAPSTIQRIENGETDRCLNRIGTALLNVSSDNAPYVPEDIVPALGARRRVQALNAIGWSCEELSRRLGLATPQISSSIGKNEITYRRWVEIRDLYEELSATPGPSVNSRARAKRHKWPAPCDWEDVAIDDPGARPTPAIATPRHIREQEKRERDSQIRAGLAKGRAFDAIAQEVGVTTDHVRRMARTDERNAA
ncbi:hypothetical protein [Prescottella agglutinans]|uniref:AraC-like DNA-binding protein n=1 Tax=Prescottella agglutinans TaxID=1644129 RepID=A0ABT6MFP6_9NOCA|nr:hypothetical protein [Prescottella agglutinans]MDH6283137.1 AraC-like DNA-binding protein [Prescottella agglutinans]